MRNPLLIAAPLLSLFGAPVVYAASDISPKFDGAYDAVTEVIPWMTSGSSCSSLVVGSVHIKNGYVSAAAQDVPGAVRGFITAEGYLEASIVSPEARAVPLNGRMDEVLLSAGAIDQDAGCAWLVKLTPHKVQDAAQ